MSVSKFTTGGFGASPSFVSASRELDRPHFWSDGSPIEALPPGWSLRRSRLILSHMHLFDIEDETGRLRSWLADRNGKLLGFRPERLPTGAAAALRLHILTRGPVEMYVQGERVLLDEAYMRSILFQPLTVLDDRLTFRDRSGTAQPIMAFGGNGFARLDPGWVATVMYTGFDGLRVMDLESIRGTRSVWFLDDHGELLGNAPEHVADRLRPAITEFAARRAAQAPGQMHPDLDGYCLLSSGTQGEIESLLTGQSGPALDPIRLAASDPGRLFANFPTTNGMAHVQRLELRGTGLIDRRMTDGWSNVDGRCLAFATGASLPFDLPYRPTCVRLSLQLQPIGRGRRVTVRLNGWDLGSFPINQTTGWPQRRDFWVPAECLESGPISFELVFSPSDRGVACCLESAALEIGPEAKAVTIPEPAELLNHFGSLGFNCEFGFVQRHYGIEPLGLFRFAGYSHRLNLLRLIETNFEGIGSSGTLVATINRNNFYNGRGELCHYEEFYMTDPVHNYDFHTWKGPDDTTEAEAIAVNEQKIKYLARAMGEDIEDGEKIWVYKDQQPVADYNEVFAIFAALNRTTPNKLFWVTPAVEGRPLNSIEWIGPNLLRAYSGQGHHDARIYDAAQWLLICQKAYRAFAEAGTLAV
ncbi:hypothetical protein [Lichenicola sp.]|uniref:hypothetical protein n=1 Tax=Lichenicola sp. TaxID=2804529 RepID=UPI003B00236D